MLCETPFEYARQDPVSACSNMPGGMLVSHTCLCFVGMWQPTACMLDVFGTKAATWRKAATKVSYRVRLFLLREPLFS